MDLNQDYKDTKLCGEIKNISGLIDADFIKALEKLMEKHKVIHVHIYWSHFTKE